MGIVIHKEISEMSEQERQMLQSAFRKHLAKSRNIKYWKEHQKEIKRAERERREKIKDARQPKLLN